MRMTACFSTLRIAEKIADRLVRERARRFKAEGGRVAVRRGRVGNIEWPSDVAGVYGAAGAGLAVGGGARAIVPTSQKGAVLELSGRQVGLVANADLSGLAITLK
jgi:hypothetical protein